LFRYQASLEPSGAALLVRYHIQISVAAVIFGRFYFMFGKDRTISSRKETKGYKNVEILKRTCLFSTFVLIWDTCKIMLRGTIPFLRHSAFKMSARQDCSATHRCEARKEKDIERTITEISGGTWPDHCGTG